MSEDRVNITEEYKARKFEERVAGLESDVSHISRAVIELTKSVERLGTSLSAQIEKVAAKSQITWPLIFGFMSILISALVVGGAIVNLRISPIEADALRNREAVSNISESVARHDERIKIYRELMVEDGNDLTRRLDNLDNVMQREMRLLDDTAAARTDGLDTILQREMNLHVSRLEDIINEMNTKIDEVRELTRDDYLRGDDKN